MERYQIFISYRREGGDILAGRLAERFTALGYKVFYDVGSMLSGTFNTQIFDAIAECNDVLLVLPPNALDRCVNDDDWVRQEISFALKHNKKIIPVMMCGFEFPKTLPADIDDIRHMEGIVMPSNEWFDAVIDRINHLLDSKASLNKASKFPVLENLDFPEDTISNILNYVFLKYPIPKNIESQVNESLWQFYSIHEANRFHGNPGREIIHTVQYGTKAYDIYDVFCYNDKKYAYGLERDVNPEYQQIGIFFSIDENDNIKPVLTGTQNMIFPDIETSNMFCWYTKNRRGLGSVPDIFLPQLTQQLQSLTMDQSKECFDLMGINTDDVNKASSVKTNEIISLLKKTNKNLLYPYISGTYKGKPVFIQEGNCFGDRFESYQFGQVVRTPLRKKIILDVSPTMLKNHYIALVYSKTKKKGINYLSEGPEYYLIKKQDNGELQFCEISNPEFWCKKYFERFALIYMQSKLLIVNSFYKK